MPSSKRNRVIPTSKTRKNHKELVRKLHSSIQESCTTYNSIYVFSVENVRNNFLKQVRVDFSDSRLCMGKTKVMQVALGRTPETECVHGVHKLIKYMTGEVGLLFTNRAEQEVRDYFETYSELDFARAGAEASQGFVVPHGELRTAYGVGGEEDQLPMSIEPTLRRLGVPTKIVRGKVTLEERPEESMETEEGYVVCKEGDTLDSRQTSILKIFGVRMAEFRMALTAMYDKSGETVKELSAMEVEETA